MSGSVQEIEKQEITSLHFLSKESQGPMQSSRKGEHVCFCTDEMAETDAPFPVFSCPLCDDFWFASLETLPCGFPGYCSTNERIYGGNFLSFRNCISLLAAELELEEAFFGEKTASSGELLVGKTVDRLSELDRDRRNASFCTLCG